MSIDQQSNQNEHQNSSSQAYNEEKKFLTMPYFSRSNSIISILFVAGAHHPETHKEDHPAGRRNLHIYVKGKPFSELLLCVQTPAH
jgi:hypothetical protein